MKLKLFLLSSIIAISLAVVLLLLQTLQNASSTATAGSETRVPPSYADQDREHHSASNSVLLNQSYSTATLLLEDTGGRTVELSSTLDHLGRFSILVEGDTYYLWLNSEKREPLPYMGVEHRFESQDRLVWRNRAETNLAIEGGGSYKFVMGIRKVIKDGVIYEGWEEYFYEWSMGWAFAVRYITSTNGITWTAVNQPSLVGARWPEVIREGNTYHMWTRTDVDASHPEVPKALRYRSSTDGGSGWGHWLTGGYPVTVDGGALEELKAVSRVRQSSDGNTFQLFYVNEDRIDMATSTNGITFTAQVTNVVDLALVLPDMQHVLDFEVVDFAGEDWFYFVYRDRDGVDHIAVSRPDNKDIYLPLVMRNYKPPIGLPLHIGDPIPTRSVAHQGEVFYTKVLRMPEELPTGGNFYFSSQPNVVAEVLVDDELAILSGGVEVYSYNFSPGGSPTPAILEAPRSMMEQLAGKTITVEYRDVYGSFVGASDMWLIWVP